jgi:hypothetical protein
MPPAKNSLPRLRSSPKHNSVVMIAKHRAKVREVRVIA